MNHYIIILSGWHGLFGGFWIADMDGWPIGSSVDDLAGSVRPFEEFLTWSLISSLWLALMTQCFFSFFFDLLCVLFPFNNYFLGLVMSHFAALQLELKYKSSPARIQIWLRRLTEPAKCSRFLDRFYLPFHPVSVLFICMRKLMIQVSYPFLVSFLSGGWQYWCFCGPPSV